MPKIFYFTTALSNNDYKEYLSYWNVPPNLSNQNFHNKFIRCIALSHPVEVISVRPINKFYKKNSLSSSSFIEENITWNYIKVSKNRVDKYLNTKKRIIEIINGKIEAGSTIFVDALNRTLLQAALKVKKEYNYRVIGICTDNPYNISYVDKKYGDTILKLTNKLDGYVVLTRKLLELFNKDKKPFLVIDGLTESVDYSTDIKINGDYLFFGGSLMRKYGVYNLIEAYKKLSNGNLKLVLCGHHEEPEFKPYIKDIPGIVYLGALSYQDIVAIEKKALCAINPRPIDPQIDEYSIPSKTLEYLSNGVPTVCVFNRQLRSRYDDGIIWAKSGSVEDIYNAIKVAMGLKDKEKEKLISNGIKYTNQHTSLSSINRRIDDLLF